jgi:hypothetical protein
MITLLKKQICCVFFSKWNIVLTGAKKAINAWAFVIVFAHASRARCKNEFGRGMFRHLHVCVCVCVCVCVRLQCSSVRIVWWRCFQITSEWVDRIIVKKVFVPTKMRAASVLQSCDDISRFYNLWKRHQNHCNFAWMIIKKMKVILPKKLIVAIKLAEILQNTH